MQVVATTAGVGRLVGRRVGLLETPFPHCGAVLEQTGSLEIFRTGAIREWRPLADCALLPPLGRPRAVWGVGLNYHSKSARTGRPAPTEPILYLSASSAAPVGGEVAVPDVQEMDYEGEIALVIGRRLYRAEPHEVWPAIAAVTAANDLSARDVMKASGSPTLAKSFPGFSPLGMSLTTPDELPEAIGVRTWVNGELVQDETSADMIFPVPELVARLSRYAALEPGDVVLTGTPAGTGQDRSCFLAPGDTVRVEVDTVLPLESVVTAPVRDGVLHV